MDTPKANKGLNSSRPWLLTVLCYLTIFGSSYMLVSSLTALSDLDQTINMLELSLDEAALLFEKAFAADPASAQKVEDALNQISSVSTRSNMRDHHVFSMVNNLLTLLGASLMLRLKKRGFHFYVLGNLIGVVAPLLVFGAGNFLGFAFSFSTSFFGALFILLYALKIKHMH